MEHVQQDSWDKGVEGKVDSRDKGVDGKVEIRDLRKGRRLLPTEEKRNPFKVAPYSFLSARALISKSSRWRKLSNSTPKSRAGSRSKMPTNMASKLLQFVYRKYCLDRFRFQNICRLNRRPQLSLLDVKEKYTRHAGVSTNEADFM